MTSEISLVVQSEGTDLCDAVRFVESDGKPDLRSWLADDTRLRMIISVGMRERPLAHFFCVLQMNGSPCMPSTGAASLGG